MLSTLGIKNYAIIEELNLSFANSFTILTGETGAGKSILLGAFSLILGKRADTSMLRDKEKKCVVEATFDHIHSDLESIFKENDIEWFPNDTVLRREIMPSGKSRAFINDCPVNLALMKEVASYLVDLHRQHETLDLVDEQFQIQMVDSVLKDKAPLQQYSTAFRTWEKAKQALADLKREGKQQQKELDYIEFTLKEIAELQLQDPEELRQLEEEHATLANADAISEGIAMAVQAFTAEQFGVLEQLVEAENGTEKAARHLPKLEELQARIESSRIELQDCAAELEDIASNIEADPQRLEWVEDRVRAITRVLEKHNFSGLQELIDYQISLATKLDQLSNLDEAIEKLHQEEQVFYKELIAAGDTLQKARVVASNTLANHIQLLFPEVGMQHGRIGFREVSQEIPQVFGTIYNQLVFSANPGQQLESLDKVEIGRAHV